MKDEDKSREELLQELETLLKIVGRVETTPNDTLSADETEAYFHGKLVALNRVGNELSTASSFDELCRQAVGLGCQALGFERQLSGRYPMQ